MISYFCQRGWTLVSHRKKIKNIEIDLVFRTKAGNLVLVEVKSGELGGPFANHRWHPNQKRRFIKALNYMQSHYSFENVYGLFALVNPKQIHFFYMDEV